jgi:phenylpropionate dioxygenase-like ring-hydroxylating dioxygenase large terminal subunit
MHSSETLPANQGYPRNQWYVAAFSYEVGANLLARTFLDVPVVMYRTPDGGPVALHDKCAHKGLPLSMGKLCGTSVQCGYHGIEFGPDGACTKIPQQSSIPSAMRVRSFPLVEKWQWIWIWMGDPAKADPGLIPDHDSLGLGRTGYTSAPFFMIEMELNFQLMHENFLDQTHVTYLHPGALDDGEMVSAQYWTKVDGNIVQLGRELSNVSASAGVAGFFGIEPDRPYDRIHIAETHVPAVNIGRNSYFDRSKPGSPPIELFGINTLTPRNRHSVYNFLALSNSFGHQWSAAEVEGLRQVVLQDKVALEAVQQRFNQFGSDSSECSLKSDHAGMACRRMISAMIEAERTGSMGSVAIPAKTEALSA